MSDASTRTITDLIRFLVKKGNGIEAILDPANFPNLTPSAISLENILGPNRAIPWNTYAAINNGLEKFFSSDDDIREYMRWSVESGAEWTATIRPVAKLFASPKTIYHVTDWATQILFSNLTAKTTIHSKTSATFVISLRPHDLASSFFFRLTACALEALPILIGYSQSSVKMYAEDKTARFEIEISPGARSFDTIAFVRKLTSLFSPKALVAQLSVRENEIRQQHSKLISAQEDLEKEVANRAAMLTKVNLKLNTLLENSPDIVVLVDREMNISYISKITSNYRESDVLGKCCLDFVPVSQKSDYESLLEDAFTKRKTGSIDLNITDNRVFLTRVIPIVENDEVLHVMAISTDITSRIAVDQRYKEARDLAFVASRAKSAFLANVSHEIRTPLTSIIGFAELLAARPLEEESIRADFYSRILSNGKHLLSLVNDILDISKIEAGTINLAADKFKASIAIEEVLQMFSIQASRSSIELINTTTDLPAIELTGDVVRFKQVLINLIGNALKFTSEGAITISANLSQIAKDNPAKVMLEVSVTDTGCGIEPTNSSYLFQPFEQADTSTVRKYGGSGLGLFLSKQIARQLGGDLVLTSSELAKGSVFTFTADFLGKLTNGAAPAPQTKSIASEIIKGIGQRILLVEDNVDLAALIRIQLEAAGYAITTVHDGKLAVEKTKEILPDLILMDLQMPVLDGYGATKELRASGIATPIVALTANASDEDRTRCIDAGFNDYWTKPMERAKLLSCVSNIFSAKE